MGANRTGRLDSFRYGAEVVGRGTNRGWPHAEFVARFHAHASSCVENLPQSVCEPPARRRLHDPLGVKGQHHIVLWGLTAGQSLVQPM
jgi:hypothetical protein